MRPYLNAILLCMFVFTININAETSDYFNYQSIIRNASGTILSNQPINLRINILEGSITGSSVYEETHTDTTNQYGAVSLKIGDGLDKTGSLSTIDWGGNIYFLKIELAPGGASDYEVISTTQLVSVPYALHAKSAKTAEIAETVADDAITSDKIKSGAVGSLEIATDAVGSSQLATSSVYTGEIANGTIMDIDISSSAAISSDKINGMPGIDYINSTTSSYYEEGAYDLRTIRTIEVACPTAGFVYLICTGYVYTSNEDRLFTLAVNSSTASGSTYIYCGTYTGTNIIYTYWPFSISYVFSVAAGTNTFNFTSEGWSGANSGTAYIYPRSFEGIFIPNKY